MKNTRIMYFYYPNDEKLIGRLKTCLDMICANYVFSFDNWYNRYIVYVDKNINTWEQVKTEVNRCKAVKFRFESGTIKNGYVYAPEDVIYI